MASWRLATWAMLRKTEGDKRTKQGQGNNTDTRQQYRHKAAAWWLGPARTRWEEVGFRPRPCGEGRMRQAHFLTELVDCESASTRSLSLLQGFMPNVLRAVSVNALLHGGKPNKETSELASIKSNRDLTCSPYKATDRRWAALVSSSPPPNGDMPAKQATKRVLA